MHGPEARQNLTGDYYSILEYHPVRQTPGPGAQFCPGETPDCKCFDICYSFKNIVKVEYSGVKQLYNATWNYRNNQLSILGKCEDVQMSYEKALRNLIVFMIGHYIDSFKSSGAQKGHWAILALKYFTVADELGWYHHWYKRADLSKPRIMKTQ